MYAITIQTFESISTIEFKTWEQSIRFFMKSISDHGINGFKGHGFDIKTSNENVPQLIFSAASENHETQIVFQTIGPKFTPFDDYRIISDFLSIDYFLKSIEAKKMEKFYSDIEIWEKNGHLIIVLDKHPTYEVLISQRFESFGDAISFIKNKFES